MPNNPRRLSADEIRSCELLSEFIIFVTRHNLNLKNLLTEEVFRGFVGFIKLE